MSEIILPNSWRPRQHQKRLWRYLEGGGRRAVAVWHRRAGKDNSALNWTAVAAHQRIGTYWHMLPTLNQARMVVWEGKDKDNGARFIDQAFPDAIRSGVNKSEMKIDLKCGSSWQAVGSDNYDRLVGANPVGVVFSEWSLTDPKAWDYVRPILAENGGWALFIFTPRGKNHGFDLYDLARHNSDWFAEVLTVEDTGAIPLSVVQDERRSGMSESLIQQEYYCSFEAPNEGSYYGKLLEEADRQGRILRVPVVPGVAVNTWWDLGMSDDMTIWFQQTVGQESHFVDYYACNGEGLKHYAKVLQDKGYVYGEHLAPHDIAVRELGTGKSRYETARELGIRFKDPNVMPKLSVEDGIEAVRNLLPLSWFDAERCKDGLKALRSYHREFNEKRQAFLPSPVHDWASHGADALRTGAVVWQGMRAPEPEDRYARRRQGRGRSYMST